MARQPAESDMARRDGAARRAAQARRRGRTSAHDDPAHDASPRGLAQPATRLEVGPRRRRSRSSPSSGRPPRGRGRSRRRSRTRSRPRSSRPTRCRSTAACRSSRTSQRVRRASSRSASSHEEMSVGRFRIARARRDRRARRAPRRGRRRRRNGAVPSRGARRPRPAATGVARRSASGSARRSPAIRPPRIGRLGELDPDAAAAVHAHDRQRLVRALELAESGDTLVGRDRLWSTATRRPTLIVGLDVPADVLERRIRERTEQMFDARGRRRGAACARGTGLAHRREGARPPRDRDARGTTTRWSESSSERAGTRRTSESGCGGSRASSPSTARSPCRRSPRRCSRESGGNVPSHAVREVARARERLRPRRAACSRARSARPRQQDLRRPHRDRQRRRPRDRLA